MNFTEAFVSIIIGVVSSGVFSLIFWFFCLKDLPAKVKDQVTLGMDIKVNTISDTVRSESSNSKDIFLSDNTILKIEHKNLSKEHYGLSKEISEIKSDFLSPMLFEAKKSGDVDSVSKDLYSNFNIIKNEIQNISSENLKLQEYQKAQLKKQEELLKDNNSLQLQIQILEEKLIDTNKFKTKYEKVINENTILIVKVDDLIKSNSKLTSGLDNLKQDNENLKLDNIELKNQNVELNKKIDTLQKSKIKKKIIENER